MEIAALILSIISLIASLACLILMLAKNFFSSHTIQYEPIDKGGFPFETGKNLFDQFRDLGDPVDPEELEKFKK